MKYRDLHDCLDSLGLAGLAEALLQCGLVDAVTSFKVMRTDAQTYVVLPILQEQLTPDRDCQPLPGSEDWPRGTGLVPTPVEKQVPLGTPLPSSELTESDHWAASWDDVEEARRTAALIRLDQ